MHLGATARDAVFEADAKAHYTHHIKDHFSNGAAKVVINGGTDVVQDGGVHDGPMVLSWTRGDNVQRCIDLLFTVGAVAYKMRVLIEMRSRT